MDYTASLREFWQRRIWRDAAARADDYAAHYKAVMSDSVRLVSQVHKENAWQFRADSIRVDELPNMVVTFENDKVGGGQGWRGDPIQLWRACAAEVLWRILSVQRLAPRRSIERRTYVDWLEESLSIDRMLSSRADFNTFWYYDVAAANVPRTWLQENLPLAQYDRRIDPNSSVDWQHGLYVYDCDVFLTSDKRLHRALCKVLEFSPRPASRVELMQLGRDTSKVVEAIGRVLES